MSIGGMRVDRNLLACDGTCGLGHIERPQQRSTRDNELVIDNVHTQTLASTPSERVLAVLRIAEVGVFRQRLLVCWEGWVEPAVRTVVVGIGVFGCDAVDGPVLDRQFGGFQGY